MNKIIISSNKGGLSNRIKSLVSCIRYSSENNIKVGVIWKVLSSYKSNYHILNCEFNKLFENRLEIKDTDLNNFQIKFYRSHCMMIFEEDNIPDNFDTYDPKNAKYTPSDIRKRNIDHNYNKIPKNVIRKYLPYFKILKPIKELNDKINSFSKKFNKKTVSVHIRSWSRKNEETRNSLLFKNGIKRFEEEMLKYKDNNFYLASDSNNVLNYFKNKSILKDKIIIYPRITNLDISRDIPEGLQEDLIELYLLSKNNIIIGSHNSTYTEVMHGG